MQRNMLKGLMTFGRLAPRQLSATIIYLSVRWAMWLIFPDHDSHLTEQGLGWEAPGAGHRRLCLTEKESSQEGKGLTGGMLHFLRLLGRA